jgi:hypothetical protein
MNRNPILCALLVALLALILVALPLSIHAQSINPCTGQAASAPSISLSSYSASSPYSCAPIPGASSTAPTIRVNRAGVTAWWYCKRPNGSWRLQFGAAAADAASVPSGSELWAAATSPDPAASANALAARYATVPIESPALAAAWCPHWPAMVAGTPAAAAIPAPPAWLTASTLAYTIRNGALGGLAGTAPRGTACDCTAPAVIGSRTYCTFAGALNPQTMTVCTRSAP